MCITVYKHTVLLLRKGFNREEGKPKRRYLTVAATVRTLALFHCEKREGIGQVCVEYANQGRCKSGDLPFVLRKYFCGRTKRKGKADKDGSFSVRKIACGNFFKEAFMKRKFLSIFLVITALICLLSCGGGEVKCTLAQVDETRVVISVEETDGKGTLLNCMEYLAEENSSFSYDFSVGMLTAINGKSNDAVANQYWMLYTSDSEMANTAWGSIEYEGETLGSAIVGAEVLIVKEGAVYVWVYQSF